MKIKKNGKVINLTESDLRRITKTVMNEQMSTTSGVSEPSEVKDELKNHSEWIKYLSSRVDDAFKAITRNNSKLK
jgi:hypothetical protein